MAIDPELEVLLPVTVTSEPVTTNRNLTIGTILLVGSGAISGLSALVFNVIVARAGGAITYAIIGPLLSIGIVVSFLANGITYAVARQVALHPRHARHVVLSQGIRMWPLWALTAAIVALVIPIQHFLVLASPVPVALAGLIWIATIFGALPNAGAVGTSRLRLIAITMFGTTLVRLALGVVAGHTAFIADAALLASLAPVVLTAIILFVALGQKPAGSSHTQSEPPKARLGNASLIAAVASTALWGLWSTPLLLAKHDLAASIAGNFASAQLIVTGCMIVTGSVVTAFYGEIARRGGLLIVVGACATFLLMTCATVFLVVLGPFIVDHLYGAGFQVQRSWFLTFGVSGTAAACANYAMWVSWARHRQRVAVLCGLASSLVVEVAIVTATVATPDGLAIAPAAALLIGSLVALLIWGVRHVTGASTGEEPVPSPS